jgi:hypothetical protein
MKKYTCPELHHYVSLLLILISAVNYRAYTQGCSDAGFCTLPGIKPVQEMSDLHNQVGVGVNFGFGDLNTNVTGYNLSYRRNLNDHIDFGVKVNYQHTDGPLGSVAGLSDLFLSSNFKTNSPVLFTLGLKIPLDRSDNRPFPMEYQPSVGTYDLLAGIAYEKNGLGLSFGLQQPLDQNEFSLDSIRAYIRQGDLLFRIFYQWNILNQKITLTPSILNIYHLGEDTYEFENGIQSNIEGSAGLTLNANIYATWHINSKFDFEIFFATPFIVRETRPDGLTRSFVTGLDLVYRF